MYSYFYSYLTWMVLLIIFNSTDKMIFAYSSIFFKTEKFWGESLLFKDFL